MAKTDNALSIIENLTCTDPEEEMVREASLNTAIAQLIHETRTKVGLTQQQLADRVDIKQSVIARLEDAEYEGLSLSVLQTIARALNHRVGINLLPSLDIVQAGYRTGKMNPKSLPNQRTDRQEHYFLS